VTETRQLAEHDRRCEAYHANERRLFARLADDRSSVTRDAIVRQFMPLARKLAWRYRDVEDIDDLEQVAAIGLVKAIGGFDPQRGLAFSTFAFPAIQGELKHHLRDRGWSVRPPRDVQTLVTRVDRGANALHAQLGRPPIVSEIAERVECPVERVLEARQAAMSRRAISLDQPRRNAGDTHGRGLEIAIDETGFVDTENAMVLDNLMRRLTQRERRVLDLCFRDDLTQAQIAAIVGISQMHVSRTIRSALERLQATATTTPPSRHVRLHGPHRFRRSP
jgi:RNA polymerase sigma-B factor